MTDSIKPSAASGSDDPWEQLAEDLFGLDYGKEHASHEPSAPSAPPAAAPTPPSPRAVAPAMEPPEITFEESPSDREFAREIPKEPAPESEGQAPAPHYAEIPVRPATPSAQDSYWDALANFNWGESERPATRSRPAAPQRDEPPRSAGPGPLDSGARDVKGQEAQRSAAPASRPAPAAAESRTDSRRNAPDDSGEFGDFGLGLGDAAGDSAPPRRDDSKPERFTTGAEASDEDEFEDDDEGDDTGSTEGENQESPATGEEGAPRKRRRRRRRRRSRQGSEGAGAPAPTAAGAPEKVPGDDWDDSAPPSAAPRKDTQRDEGPRREERSHRPGDGRRDSGRRDERSRGPRRRHDDRREPPAAPVVGRRSLPADDDFGEESPEDEIMNVGGGEGSVEFTLDEGGGDGSDSLTDFGEVPTWEEAISYLLNPQRVQVDSNGGSDSEGSESRTGPPARQTRHYGGRRP